ncbi:hypothetical protein DMI65_16955 [Escherichia coli]|nr:hypothetical protein [Escherichia coli]
MRWQRETAALCHECNRRDRACCCRCGIRRCKTSAGRRDAISSINSVTRLMALAAVSLQARLQANPAMASAVDTVTGLGASFGLL